MGVHNFSKASFFFLEPRTGEEEDSLYIFRIYFYFSFFSFLFFSGSEPVIYVEVSKLDLISDFFFTITA